MWSWAWKRIAVSSSSRSSIFGNFIERTATRWLATPTRTLRESLCSANSVLIAAPSASGSATSPSRKAPGSSGTTPYVVTAVLPFWLTSAAATLPASMSRPTTEFDFVAWSI